MVCNIWDGYKITRADNVGEKFYEFCGGFLRMAADAGCEAGIGLVAVSADAQKLDIRDYLQAKESKVMVRVCHGEKMSWKGQKKYV